MAQPFDLVQTREKLLFRFLGISPKDIYNDNQDVISTYEDISLISDLKQAVNKIQAQMVSSNGKTIDYGTLASSKIYQDLRTKLTPQLRYFNPNTLKTNADRLAFWINLYNVLVIDSVIHQAVKFSVTEGFFGILRFFRQAAYDIGGYRTSLEDIEHGILRGNRGNPFIPGPQFAIKDPRQSWVISPVDPRIHFALNCASKSCPLIRIYSPEQIDTQLDFAAQNFIMDDVSFDPETNTLKLSRIFQWFAVDFGGKAGLLKFLQGYLQKNNGNSLAIEQEGLRMKFKQYDWGLNNKI